MKPEIETMRRLFSFTKAVGDPDRSWDVEAVTSDETLDRENEVIEPQGWILDPYLMNPVVLAYHQHRLATGNSPVVGSAPDTRVNTDGKLRQFVGFAAREPNATALGTEYRNLYRGRHMRAFSVGFTPLEGGARTTSSGSGKSSQVYHHTKQELLEVSCVPVGANPNALARIAKSLASGLDDEALGKLADLVLERLKSAVDAKVFVRDVAAAIGLGDALNPVALKIEKLEARFEEVKDLLAALAPDTLGLDGPDGAVPAADGKAGAGGEKEDGAMEHRRLAEEARALEEACGA